MDTQIQCWRAALTAMTQPQGWIGLRDGKANLAETVLAHYDASDAWIGHSFAALMQRKADGKERAEKTDAAREAERRRDAVLQLAFVHELALWRAHQRDAISDAITALTKAVGETAGTAPIGLRPRKDFAGGDRATQFFGGTLLPRIREVDKKLGTAMATRLEQLPYDPGNEQVIGAWARAWTAAAALIPLEWARQRNLRTARDVALATWLEVDSSGQPLPQFHPRAAIIPTASKLARAVYLDLVTRPAVALALGRSHEIRVLDEGRLCGLSISLSELDYESNFGHARYRGRNVLQLYLAVLAECLHEANKDGSMGEHDPSSADPGAGDTGDGTALPDEHRRALAHMQAARQSLQAIKQAATGRHRFMPGHEVPAAGGSASRALVEQVIEWELLVLNRRDFIVAEEEPAARWQPIGSVRLWRELGPDLDWIDILFAARIGDQQLRLPITMEDKDSGDDDAERSLLVLDTAANAPVNAAELRAAFGRPDAVVGVVIRKGLGAFVVVEVDMNAREADGFVV